MPRRPASPARRTAARRTTPRPASPTAPAGPRPGVRAARVASGGAAEHDGAPHPGAGPARESRPARVARLVSVRALVLTGVLLTAFTLLFPTARAYLAQQAELDALADRLAEAEAREAALGDALGRWDDDAYVVARARERLAYVRPGETSYRVIDSEVVEPDEPVVEGAEPGDVDGPALPVGGDVNPWYATVWESVQVAGEAEVVAE